MYTTAAMCHRASEKISANEIQKKKISGNLNLSML